MANEVVLSRSKTTSEHERATQHPISQSRAGLQPPHLHKPSFFNEQLQHETVLSPTEFNTLVMLELVATAGIGHQHEERADTPPLRHSYGNFLPTNNIPLSGSNKLAQPPAVARANACGGSFRRRCSSPKKKCGRSRPRALSPSHLKYLRGEFTSRRHFSAALSR